KPKSRSNEGGYGADQIEDEARKGWIESAHFRPPERAAIGETIPFAIAIELTQRIKNLKGRDRQFDRDQNHDDDLESQRALGVDRVGEDLGGIGDDGELARQRFGAFFQLIFVLEPRIEPIQVLTVPDHVGFFSDANASRQAVLHQERIADMSQDGSAATMEAAFFSKLAGERLDDIEHAGDFAFVSGQDDALRQRVGDDDQMLRRNRFEEHRTARQNLVLLIRRLLDQ